MAKFQRMLLAFSAATYFACSIQSTSASSSTVKYHTLKEAKGDPSLGRGYSTMTNEFHSTCFDFNRTATEHSYTFEYYMTDFTKVEEYSANLSSEISKSLGYRRVKSIVAKSRKAQQAIQQKIEANPNDKELNTKTNYNVVVTLRIERFFTSLVETNARISEDPKKLLEDEQYINFFMTCGPNYVRTLKRAQEVTAIISFKADDQYLAQGFAESLRLHIYGNGGKGTYSKGKLPSEFSGFDMDQDFDDTAMRKSLSIEILGYGLGLNRSGSETLVATSLDELNEVMKFSYASITKKTESIQSQAGVIYEMETLPWTDNVEFLAAVKVDEKRIIEPVPLGMIEQARQGSIPCRSSESEPDDFGHCCDPLDKVTLNLVNEMGSRYTKQLCEPKQFMSSQKMTDHLHFNSEFITWLVTSARGKAKDLSTLGQCVNNLRALPEQFDYMFLRSNNKANYDESIDMKYTVKELKAALDPAASLRILTMVSDENEEFMEMFYHPCMAALYGRNYGDNKQTEPKYIMAQPWHNLKECMHPTCLQRNMAWDRKNGNGCVPGILGRKSEKDQIPYSTDAFCSKKMDPSSGKVSCKHNYTPHSNILMQMDNCREALPQGKDGKGRPEGLTISYLMEYFCMPKVAMTKKPADELKMDEVDEALEICMTPVNEPVPSVYPSATPTNLGTEMPSVSQMPTLSQTPSSQPSSTPSSQPSSDPTNLPSTEPSVSQMPSVSAKPSSQPSNTPSSQPSNTPSIA